MNYATKLPHKISDKLSVIMSNPSDDDPVIILSPDFIMANAVEVSIAQLRLAIRERKMSLI